MTSIVKRTHTATRLLSLILFASHFAFGRTYSSTTTVTASTNNGDISGVVSISFSAPFSECPDIDSEGDTYAYIIDSPKVFSIYGIGGDYGGVSIARWI